MLSLIPPSTRDVGATGAAVERDLLDGADLVDRAHARADDRAAGLDREPRHRDAERAALVLDDLGHLGGQLRGLGRVVLGGVGDAEAAAEVHLGQRRRRARRRSGRAAPAPGGPRPRSRRCRRSGCRCGECRPSSSSPGRPATRRTASKASPPVIEKPNFWSSWAVAMYSWVCASTPAVTRTITRAVSAELAGRACASRSISSKESTMIRPTPASTRAAQLVVGLVVAVVADPRRVEAGPQRDGELAGGADVEAEPLLGDPARDRRAEERLAGVVDVVAAERVAERRGPGPGSRPRRGRTPGCRARRPGRSGRTPPT